MKCCELQKVLWVIGSVDDWDISFEIVSNNETHGMPVVSCFIDIDNKKVWLHIKDKFHVQRPFIEARNAVEFCFWATLS